MKTSLKVGSIALVLALVAAGQASAGLITNGGFESGFSGWTRVDQLGSDGTFSLQTGTTSPVNGDPVPSPPEDTTAAMSDGGAPGSHVLYQDFVVPTTSIGSALLSFQLFIGNRASFGFSTPDTLDFTIPNLNQQARVDILRGGSDPFSLSANDLLMNIYSTNEGDPLVTGYNIITANLTALLNANQGQTLRLRFVEVDNSNGAFQLGVDNVSIEAIAPEPSTLITAGIAVLGGLGYAHRRRSNTKQ